MRGGVILFRGTGTAARRYLESDRSQADEYYLEAGAARAELSVVDGSGRVIDERALTPVEYAGWVDWIGPRGQQEVVPVERLETVGISHRTSRAGDPHRHIHFQIGTRVWAGGAWRGLDTAALFRQQGAIRALGTAVLAAHPRLAAVLDAHRLTLDPVTGEVAELRPFNAVMSKRASRVARNLAVFEAQWEAAHPGREPGPTVSARLQARAWDHDRPNKKPSRLGSEAGCRRELDEAGYTPDLPSAPRRVPVALDELHVQQVASDVALLGAIAAAASVVQWLPWAPLVAAPLLLAAAFLVLSRPVTRPRGVAATVLVLLVVAIPVVGHLRHETGGRMISVDDTGRRSHPIQEGWIVVLPSADATWDLLGARPGATDFEYLGASLDEDDVAAAGGRVQPIGRWGRFDLPVEPGDWVLCYVPAWSNTEFGFVAGCSAVQLSAGDLVEASWGEGGFWAS